MRRAALLMVMLLWSGVARADAPAAEVPALPDLAARVTPSVVLVKLFDAAGKEAGSGSGFFVASDGRVITNHHVIDGAESAKVVLSDSREAKVLGVLADDPENDLALLQVEGSNYPTLTLVGAARARVGEDVVVIGSPLGFSTTVTSGVLSAIREKGIASADDTKGTAWTLHFTAPITNGSSGSPILTRRGDVIGVAVGTYGGSEGMNFGIRAERAIELLSRASASAKPLSAWSGPEQRNEILRNLAISGAIFLGVFVGWRVLTRSEMAERTAAKRR